MRKLTLCCLSMISMVIVLPLTHADTNFGRKICHSSGYTCLHVRDGQTWSSLFPDPHDRSIVMRVNRMNIRLWGGQVLAVPNNLSHADIMDFAPFPSQIQSRGEKIVAVDPSLNAWGAYTSDGKLLRWGPVSTGRDWCNDIDEACRTHTGVFRVFSLGSSDCYSTKFPLPDGGAPMPYCMYFNNGQALHGEPNGLPGYNDSHGCVRMYVSDAEWLRYSFIEGPNDSNHFKGTRVIVGKYATPEQDDGDNNDGNDNG